MNPEECNKNGMFATTAIGKTDEGGREEEMHLQVPLKPAEMDRGSGNAVLLDEIAEQPRPRFIRVQLARAAPAQTMR